MKNTNEANEDKDYFYLVYFLLLPSNKIKIGESTILRFAYRFDEAQRYFQGDVIPLKVIRFPTKSGAVKMESFYKRRFERKREIFDNTPRLRKFIDRRKRAEPAEPYLRLSRALRKKKRKRDRKKNQKIDLFRCSIYLFTSFFVKKINIGIKSTIDSLL